ncbi:Alpha-L-Rha alpha-1,2-L-rhamnosyltransferase/alpha-L-Rha alpha-1,3-L-rhamnosyltransferase [hydrothermal vent metagenome]|uniref:Alpha-L-Rha alpha-1,2-L-rhamnosyltransferase/alpha-L-Rha alpha-1,3-L-rhamnosyltransferase n=1 Tax=hydrothermal vent metagenome TaxID=652676 RepID=A0A3B0W3S0_9ZZZZ
MRYNLKIACIFAHYDNQNEVDEYVIFYLKSLKEIVQTLVFVSTSSISDSDVLQIEAIGVTVIIRENIGYDFYSYKVGLEALSWNEYSHIIICNDSVYGPIYPLENVFKQMQATECDFWGITSSESIGFHLQSYFLVFKKNVISAGVFKKFWEDLTIINNKFLVVKKYEVGLTKTLIANNYKSAAFVKNVKLEVSKSLRFIQLVVRLVKSPIKIFKFIKNPSRYLIAINKIKVNPSLESIKSLVVRSKSPFIKTVLFKGLEAEQNLSIVKNVIPMVSSYDYLLIKHHIARISSPNDEL